MREVSAASWGDFGWLARRLAPLMWAFTLGSTVGAVLLAAVAYRVSLLMILAHRRRMAQTHGETG
jgi:hypothetical protein